MPPLGLSCLGLCTSWTWLAVSFSMLNKLLTHQLWDQGNEINYQVLFLFPFWGPYNAMLVCLILFQRPARLSPFLFILSVYSLLWQWCPSFCPPGHLSILRPQLFCYWFFLVYFSFQVLCCIFHLCLFVYSLFFGKDLLHLFNLCLHSLHSFSEILDYFHYSYSEFFFWKVAYLHFI